jgi:predicted nucleotidyltransferase
MNSPTVSVGSNTPLYGFDLLCIMRIYLRTMHNKRPVDILFPKVRQGILAATYGQPNRSWYLSELAEHLETTPSSLQRELKSLTASKLLREFRDGKRVYFQAETASPLFAPLRELIEQTLGIVPALKDALSPLEKQIHSAFVYGSTARAEEHTMSDVDIVVIGSLGLSDLSSVLRNLERRYDREFNAVCYAPQEFSEKVHSQHHFLTSILKKEKIFLIGDADDLDGLINEQNGTNSPDEQK